MKGLDAKDLAITKDVSLPKDPFSIENVDNWQRNLNESELPIGLDIADQEDREALYLTKTEPIKDSKSRLRSFSPSPGKLEAESLADRFERRSNQENNPGNQQKTSSINIVARMIDRKSSYDDYLDEDQILSQSYHNIISAFSKMKNQIKPPGLPEVVMASS